jgi:hypothetical protein
LAQEAEAFIRAGYAAWNEGDLEAISSRSRSRAGFGFRNVAARGTQDPEAGPSPGVLRSFFDSFEYFNVSIDEIHTAVYGDVVVAWGFHTEDFKHRGMDPEVVKVRFSSTVIRGENGQLRTILGHRDIQPFDAEGRYIPQSP